jgi:Holliday junction DNA helicase RuvA
VYEYLEGVIAAHGPARIVLDVGGVGYDVHVPLGARFPPTGRARIWTHLVVREDAHTLCGFPDRETRDLFRLLLSVRGVGPVMALGILSGLPREPLLDAVANGDAATLTKIRGVGKKTAEQILLDMREKAALLRAELSAGPGATGAPSSAARANDGIDDAVQALVSIGYSEKEAKKSVERAAQRVDKKNLELLVRTALTI